MNPYIQGWLLLCWCSDASAFTTWRLQELCQLAETRDTYTMPWTRRSVQQWWTDFITILHTFVIYKCLTCTFEVVSTDKSMWQYEMLYSISSCNLFLYRFVDMKHPSEFSLLSPSLSHQLPFMCVCVCVFLVVFIHLSWIFNLGQDIWDFFWMFPHLHATHSFLSILSPGRERTIGNSRQFRGVPFDVEGAYGLWKTKVLGWNWNSFRRKHLSSLFILEHS